MCETFVLFKRSDGRKFVFTYWNEDKEKVKSEALNAIKNIDERRQPHIDQKLYPLAIAVPYGSTHKCERQVNGWAIDIAYYSLD